MSFTNMTDNILSNKSLKLIATDKPLTTTDKIVHQDRHLSDSNQKNQTGFNFKLVLHDKVTLMDGFPNFFLGGGVKKDALRGYGHNQMCDLLKIEM